MRHIGKTLAIISTASFVAFGYAVASHIVPLAVISFLVAVITRALEEGDC